MRRCSNEIEAASIACGIIEPHTSETHEWSLIAARSAYKAFADTFTCHGRTEACAMAALNVSECILPTSITDNTLSDFTSSDDGWGTGDSSTDATAVRLFRECTRQVAQLSGSVAVCDLYDLIEDSMRDLGCPSVANSVSFNGFGGFGGGSVSLADPADKVQGLRAGDTFVSLDYLCAVLRGHRYTASAACSSSDCTIDESLEEYCEADEEDVFLHCEPVCSIEMNYHLDTCVKPAIDGMARDDEVIDTDVDPVPLPTAAAALDASRMALARMEQQKLERAIGKMIPSIRSSIIAAMMLTSTLLYRPLQHV